MAVQYKFVEVTPVTDESLETCVNEWVQDGWCLEGIRFVMSESSRRPTMAFVSFTREAPQRAVDGEAPRRARPLVTEERPPDPGGDPMVITAAGGADVD